MLKLDNIKALLLGALNPASLLTGLPGILAALLGGGNLKDQSLKLFRRKLDAQEARTAGKELAFLTHKAISAVANVTPAEHREAATVQFAQAVALQYVQAAEEAIAFAHLAVAREAARGNGGDAEKAAIDAREAGELRMVQQGTDIGRVINGSDPQIGD